MAQSGNSLPLQLAQGKMAVLKEQIITTCEIAEQLIAMNYDFANNHSRGFQAFENKPVKSDCYF